MQPGKTISPERANPGPNKAPFGSGYLISAIPFIQKIILTRIH
jgi:hypothetical protein